MRAMTLTLVLLLASPALAGDVWMQLDVSEPDGTVHVELPALAAVGADDARLFKHGVEVDWRREIAALSAKKVGATAQYTLTLDDGSPAPVVLQHRAAREGRVDTLDISINTGFLASVPLAGGPGTVALSDGTSSLIAQSPFSGMDMGSEPVLRIIGRAAPTTLVRIADRDGNDLMVRVR